MAIGLTSGVRFAKSDGGGIDSLDRAQMDKVGFDPPKCKFSLLCCCTISKPIGTFTAWFL